MEQLKRLDAVFEPDLRVPPKDRTLESDHKLLSELRLSPTTPEEVQSYFETIKNICLYARFVYAFYSVAAFLTYPLIELALGMRLRSDYLHDKTSTLSPLLKEAIQAGLINSDEFSHVKAQRARWQAHVEELAEAGFDVPTFSGADTYLENLTKDLPKKRNIRAHPKHMPLITPGTCFFSIRFAAEFINQLYR